MEQITHQVVQWLLEGVGGIVGLYLIRLLKRASASQHSALERSLAKQAVLWVESIGSSNGPKLHAATVWLEKKLPWAKQEDLVVLIEAALREAKADRLAH